MSSGAKKVFVFCSTKENFELWTARAPIYSSVEIRPLYPVSSGWETLHELISEWSTEPVAICREDVWFSLQLGDSISSLIAELDDTYKSWGICGNRGTGWNKGKRYDFTRNKRFHGIVTSCGPKPVLFADDNLLLLNTPVLSRAGLRPIENIDGTSIGLLLSLECLLNRLLVLADPRLLTVRTGEASEEEEKKLQHCEAFREYYAANFLQHRISTANGSYDFAEDLDYGFLHSSHPNEKKRDLLELFDQALEAARVVPPSLTICCRTQLKRPEMLERTLTSIAALASEANGLVQLQVALITDAVGAEAEGLRSFSSEMFPGLHLQFWQHTARGSRYSRVDLLIAAIERAGTDYIWFIDDDDFVYPSAIRPISRDLLARQPILFSGVSVAMDEEWSDRAPEEVRVLVKSEVRARYPADALFRAFTGENGTPICSLILPVALALDRLAGKAALGDYNEDYFLLLLLLTSRRIEVCPIDLDLAGVSIRGVENTVAGLEKSKWFLSYTTFLQEALLADDANPILWQLANLPK